MRAGKLRERCGIHVATPGTDSVGSSKPTWSPLAMVWSQWTPVAGADGMVEGTQRTTERYTVTIRFRNGIAAGTNRLGWRGRIWNINSVLPDERGESLVLEVSSGDGSGSP